MFYEKGEIILNEFLNDSRINFSITLKDTDQEFYRDCLNDLKYFSEYLESKRHDFDRSKDMPETLKKHFDKGEIFLNDITDKLNKKIYEISTMETGEIRKEMDPSSSKKNLQPKSVEDSESNDVKHSDSNVYKDSDSNGTNDLKSESEKDSEPESIENSDSGSIEGLGNSLVYTSTPDYNKTKQSISQPGLSREYVSARFIGEMKYGDGQPNKNIENWTTHVVQKRMETTRDPREELAKYLQKISLESKPTTITMRSSISKIPFHIKSEEIRKKRKEKEEHSFESSSSLTPPSSPMCIPGGSQYTREIARVSNYLELEKKNVMLKRKDSVRNDSMRNDSMRNDSMRNDSMHNDSMLSRSYTSVPTWAIRENVLKRLHQMQEALLVQPANYIEKLFGTIRIPQIEEIFGTKSASALVDEAKNHLRPWESPVARPRIGTSKYEFLKRSKKLS